MSKKCRFRALFDKYHGKRTKTLLNYELEHLYHIYWSLWRQISWTKSLLVISKIFGLFVNTLTADDKYCLLKRDDLLQHLHIQLSQKKSSFSFFFCIFEIYTRFSTVSKKRSPSKLMYFWTYGNRKTLLDKCLKLPFEGSLRRVTW